MKKRFLVAAVFMLLAITVLPAGEFRLEGSGGTAADAKSYLEADLVERLNERTKSFGKDYIGPGAWSTPEITSDVSAAILRNARVWQDEDGWWKAESTPASEGLFKTLTVIANNLAADIEELSMDDPEEKAILKGKVKEYWFRAIVLDLMGGDTSGIKSAPGIPYAEFLRTHHSETSEEFVTRHISEFVAAVEKAVMVNELTEKPEYTGLYEDDWNIMVDLVLRASAIRGEADRAMQDTFEEADDYLKYGDGTIPMKTLDRVVKNGFADIRKLALDPINELLAEAGKAIRKLEGGSDLELTVSSVPSWNEENGSWSVELENGPFGITMTLPYEVFTGKKLSVPSDERENRVFMEELAAFGREIAELKAEAHAYASFDEESGMMEISFNSITFPNRDGKHVRVLSWEGTARTSIRVDFYESATEKSIIDRKFSFKNGELKEKYSGPSAEFAWKTDAGFGALYSFDSKGYELVGDVNVSLGTTLFSRLYLGAYVSGHFFMHDAVLLDIGGEMDILLGKHSDFAIITKAAWNWEQSLLNFDAGVSYRIGSLFNIGLEVTTRDMFSLIGGRVTVGVSGL